MREYVVFRRTGEVPQYMEQGGQYLNCHGGIFTWYSSRSMNYGNNELLEPVLTGSIIEPCERGEATHWLHYGFYNPMPCGGANEYAIQFVRITPIPAAVEDEREKLTKEYCHRVREPGASDIWEVANHFQAGYDSHAARQKESR